MKNIMIIVLALLVGYPAFVAAVDFPSDAASIHVSWAFFTFPIVCSYEHYYDVGNGQIGIGAGISLVPNYAFVVGPAIGPHISASIILGRKALRFESKVHVSLFFQFLYYFDIKVFPGVNIGLRYQQPKSPFFCRFTLGLLDGVGVALGYAF